MINVEVSKTGNENNTSLIRKFTKKVQESGVVRRVRNIRYKQRSKSPYVTKKAALSSLSRRMKLEEMIKMGKNPEILKRR